MAATSTYCEEITAAASVGHQVRFEWHRGVASVATTEDPSADCLEFWPCEPSGVATWTIRTEATAWCADADPLLRPVGTGPVLHSDPADVGRWMAHVFTTIAGRRPAVAESYRDWTAEGFHTTPEH